MVITELTYFQCSKVWQECFGESRKRKVTPSLNLIEGNLRGGFHLQGVQHCIFWHNVLFSPFFCKKYFIFLEQF